MAGKLDKRRAISVYLSEAERAQLERVAKREQRSISHLARMLVLEGLKRAGKRAHPTPAEEE